MTPIKRAARAMLDEALKIEAPSSEYGQAECEQLVRAVLTAIREPSKAVLDAGIRAAEDVEDYTQDSYSIYRVDNPSDMPRPVWQAMIDAMLAEEG